MYASEKRSASSERAAFERELARVAPAPPQSFIPHAPHPKQAEFLALTCREALYGGAAGGGKTDALLMAAAQYVHVPGYAALLLRRTYADLARDDAIMSRAKAWWLPMGIDWSEKEKRFTFPSGATIAFGYLDHDNDKYAYQGGAWQFLGFDELTQFPEAWYRYLLSRLRRLAGSLVPIRARGASNPGGTGHDWVKRRFVDAGAPGAFVPAVLRDNPSLDTGEYAKALALLDPTTRRQLEEGIWVRDGKGLVYGHFDEKRNLLQAAPNKPGEALGCDYYLLGLDFGIVDQNACAVLGWRQNDPCVYVVECYRITATVSEMADEVKRLEDKYRFVQIVGDTGGMGKAFAVGIAERHGIPVDDAEKNNKLGYIRMLNSDLARGRIKVVEPSCAELLSEWRELPWNESATKECDGFDNHASDATLYAWRACQAFLEQPLPEKPKPGTVEFYDAQEQRIQEALERNLEQKQRAQWWE